MKFDDFHSHDKYGNKEKEKPTWEWNTGWPHHKEACYHLSYL
jgi:hypothetical protein